MNRSRLAVLLVLSLVLYGGCKRIGTPIGGKGKDTAPIAEPNYSVTTNSATTVQVSNVAEVAPKFGSGAIDGAAIFGKTCAACHQLNGQGIPGAFPPLDGSPYVTGDNVERMASIMIYGLVGPVKVKGVAFASAMAPLGPTLKDEELAAVASYVRNSWSNKAAPIPASVFTEMRKKWGTRGPFAIAELGEEQ